MGHMHEHPVHVLLPCLIGQMTQFSFDVTIFSRVQGNISLHENVLVMGLGFEECADMSAVPTRDVRAGAV